MTEDQIKHMVNRFLGWKLPDNFNPDGGVSFEKTFNEHTDHPMKHEPSGTNLLDATQAEAMIRYLLDGLQSPEITERHSTHYVHRGPESLPCYCAASSDHSIGQEQAHPPHTSMRVTDLHVEAAKLALVKYSVLMPTDAAIRDMLAAAASMAASAAHQNLMKPMAWWWEDKSGGLHLTLDREDVHQMAREMFCEAQPLYSHPAPPENRAIGGDHET